MPPSNTSPDTFKILITSDSHLGYGEKDSLRQRDSIETFKEVLEIAVNEDVDFILLGGDLFHENKPSKWVINECLKLLRKYCLGERPIEFQLVSDESENFSFCAFPNVNYEDSNLNVAYPVFTIHGNHDDPTGSENLSSIDILSTSGLVNYFGKVTNMEEIRITPLLLQKGKTKIALYGLGSVRDERLHRLFREGHVSMFRPREKPDDWFNIFVLHQNRAKHGPTNHIPESYLSPFLDLVIWGHEHECRIDPEVAPGKIYISQPGSTVATSLCPGEAVQKHVGILEVTGRNFRMRKIPLQTVRQFYFDNISLNDVVNDDHNLIEAQILHCSEYVDSLLEKAQRQRSGHRNQPELPLIRLRVEHDEFQETFNPYQLGQRYVGKVANPKDIVIFSRKKSGARTENLDSELFQGVLGANAFEKNKVEDLVKKYFENVDESKALSLLTENGMKQAISSYVEKEYKESIAEVVRFQEEKTLEYLKSLEKIREDSIIDEIIKFKEERMQKMEEEDREIKKWLSASQKNPENGDGNSDDISDISDGSNDDDMDSKGKRGGGKASRGNTSAKGPRMSRGPGRGRGGRGRRGRGKSCADEDDDNGSSSFSAASTSKRGGRRKGIKNL